jgi:PAS domain S-box-containing protein
LEEERARFDTLLDEMPAGVIIVDAGGNLIRGNEQSERIWREPILKKAEQHAFPYRALHSDGRPYRPEEWPLALAVGSGEMVSGKEITIVRGDGSRGVISVSSGPIRDVRGRIIAGVMVFQDVTERKEAEQTRRKLAALVESSGQVGINLTEESGIITTWSRGAQGLYGYRAEEVIGKDLSLLVPPGFPNDIPALVRRLKNGETVERHEAMRARKDGSLVPVSLNMSPVRNTEDEVVGASIVATESSSGTTRQRRSSGSGAKK